METLCYALLAGYAPLGAAIAVLWRTAQKAQRELLEEQKRRVRMLEAMIEVVEKKKEEP